MPGGYKRALFFRHALGNKLLTFLCDVVCDLNLTDMETCYKMVRADLLKSIPLKSSTFDVEPELAIKLAKRGSRESLKFLSAIRAAPMPRGRKSAGVTACVPSGLFLNTQCPTGFFPTTRTAAKS